MAVSKYAAETGRIKAREESNKRENERLEREAFGDEAALYTGIGLAAAAGTIALMAGPLGWGMLAAVAAGTAGGLIAGKGTDIVLDMTRENSALDKAIAETIRTGSTSWMDSEGAADIVGGENKLDLLQD
jgi:hypothetical protein